MLVNDAGAERQSKEAREILIVDTDSFFREISKSRMRSRRARRRDTMHRCEEDWQG